MNGGIIATIAAIIALLMTFLLGRKTGAVKEDEKLKVEIEAYTEKIKETTAKAESAEKKADLAGKVAQTVADAAIARVASVVSLSDLTKVTDEESAIEAARKQAEAAKEFIR